VYTAANDIGNARAYYSDLKNRLEARGRSRESLKVLFGVAPVIADTEAAAYKKLDQLDDLINFEAARGGLQKLLGNVNISEIGLDQKIPASLLPETSQAWVESRYKLIRELAIDKGYTVRQLIKVAQRGGGHFSPIGSVEQVGNQLIEWFDNGAADGFNFLPLAIPVGMDDITDKLIPYLQDRSYFRRDYRDGTYRENLGLPAIDRPQRAVA
jgi:alkanesulfonate monooxygenase SsuD/methylene tetrahydromethanopterin reductase-like flavin-dependent oxidoreductase (luciferase family)